MLVLERTSRLTLASRLAVTRSTGPDLEALIEVKVFTEAAGETRSWVLKLSLPERDELERALLAASPPPR